MAITGKELEIDGPCPVNLDRKLSDGRHRAWGCGHCDKTVHVLSSMTERGAREFLKMHEGQTLCITYMLGQDGLVQFQPDAPVVPVARLTRRRALATAGFAAALAACTPSQDAADGPSCEPVAEVQDAGAADEQAPATEAHSSMAQLVAEARAQAEAAEFGAAARSDDPDAVETEATVSHLETIGTAPVGGPVARPFPGRKRIPSIAPPVPTKVTKGTPRRGARRMP